jgi:hypothetical protein
MVTMTEDGIRWAVRCRGHRPDGSRCKRWSIRGGFVCPTHGGRAPQVRRAAQRRLTEAALCRTFAAWTRSPAGQEYRDQMALASDRRAVEIFSGRLGRGGEIP